MKFIQIERRMKFMDTKLNFFRQKLLEHEIYRELDTPEKVKIFMKHHVFAVWDFMSLLKRIQNSVTCVTVPWIPYEKALYSRLINDITVAEESDIDGRGGYLSHFSLYLEAMDEVGADKSPIVTFIDALKSGEIYKEALQDKSIPKSVADFVSYNLDLAEKGEIHEVVAAFFYGREGLIPDMFRPLVDSIVSTDTSSDRLLFYINRHIEVDEGHHGPLAEQLLSELCNGDAQKIEQAINVGKKCYELRARLWDGVLKEIDEKN
jgi:hypothetical protein